MISQKTQAGQKAKGERLPRPPPDPLARLLECDDADRKAAISAVRATVKRLHGEELRRYLRELHGVTRPFFPMPSDDGGETGSSPLGEIEKGGSHE